MKIRYFFRNPGDLTDTTAKYLYFIQLQEKVINGDIPVSETDAIKLAAIHLQTSMGDFNRKTINRKGLFQATLKMYVPFYLADYHSKSWWEKKIFTVHGKLRGLTKEEVMNGFLKVISSMPNYGLTYFAGIVRTYFATVFFLNAVVSL